MLIVGHRGAAGHVPENTLASFDKALAMGVDAVECDVHLCKTGEPVVIHDARLERTTNGIGYVRDHTLAELKRLDAGQGERLPTLTELLNFIDRRVTVFVEMKAEDCAKAVVELVSGHVQTRGWSYAQLPLVSFNHPMLVEARRLNPQIVTGAILEGLPVDYAACAERAGAQWANPCIDWLNAAFIADARARGLKVMTWTCNTPEKISKAKALSVDALATDFPEKAT